MVLVIFEIAFVDATFSHVHLTFQSLVIVPDPFVLLAHRPLHHSVPVSLVFLPVSSVLSGVYIELIEVQVFPRTFAMAVTFTELAFVLVSVVVGNGALSVEVTVQKLTFCRVVLEYVSIWIYIFTRVDFIVLEEAFEEGSIFKLEFAFTFSDVLDPLAFIDTQILVEKFTVPVTMHVDDRIDDTFIKFGVWVLDSHILSGV